MKARTVVNPDRSAEDRAAIEELWWKARRQAAGGHGMYWSEAARRIEAAMNADPPDLAAAKRAYRYGHHITLDDHR